MSRRRRSSARRIGGVEIALGIVGFLLLMQRANAARMTATDALIAAQSQPAMPYLPPSAPGGYAASVYL